MSVCVPGRPSQTPDAAGSLERCETGGEAVPVPAKYRATFRPKGLRGGIDGKIWGHCHCPAGAES